MTQRHSAIVSDDELVRIARRYRRESIATLITICRNEQAPASARAQASAKLLEYSDGKPGQARQITTADLASMSDDLRMQLMVALVDHYTPNGFKLMVKESVDAALAQAAALPKPPRPNRFTRRSPAPSTEPPAADPGEAAIRSDLSGISAVAGGSQPADPTPALQRALIASPTRRGRGPDRAADYDTPYARSLPAENSERRRRQDAAPTANSPPPAPGPPRQMPGCTRL